MATPHRPGYTACTNGTPECSGSTECTQCARHPVHDSFHDQQAASGPHIALSDGVQVTHSERRTVTSAPPENAPARTPGDHSERAYGSIGAHQSHRPAVCP